MGIVLDVVKAIGSLSGLTGKPKSERVQMIKEARKVKRRAENQYWKMYRKFKRGGFDEAEKEELQRLRDGIAELDEAILSIVRNKA